MDSKVTGLRSIGGAYRNGTRIPGAVIVITDDGKNHYFQEDSKWDDCLAALREQGYSTEEYEARLDQWVSTGK